MRNLYLTFALIAFVGCVATKPLPRFCGLELGQELDVLDADVRCRYGLGNPVTVVEAKDGFTHYQCDSLAPKDGFDSFAVDVTTNGIVFAIYADIKCDNAAEVAAKREEIISRFAGRAKEDGDITFTVHTGDDYVEVDITESKGGL